MDLLAAWPAGIAPRALPAWAGVLLILLLALALAEGLVLARRGAYCWREAAASFGDALLRRGFDALGLSLAAPLLAWAWQHRLTGVAPQGAAGFVLLLLGTDLAYYALHRASHRVRWFWATHAVHHSPTRLTLANALRLGASGKLSGSAIFFAPLLWLGFAPQQLLAALALNLLYQFFLHAAWLPRLPAAVEWVFNTPSHHRVHHGCNAAYLDCKYGGILIVFDRLFGSFVAERADEAPRYGLVEPIRSHNPLRIALHEWLRLARDLRQAPDHRVRLLALLGPPGAARAAIDSRNNNPTHPPCPDSTNTA